MKLLRLSPQETDTLTPCSYIWCCFSAIDRFPLWSVLLGSAKDESGNPRNPYSVQSYPHCSDWEGLKETYRVLSQVHDLLLQSCFDGNQELILTTGEPRPWEDLVARTLSLHPSTPACPSPSCCLPFQLYCVQLPAIMGGNSEFKGSCLTWRGHQTKADAFRVNHLLRTQHFHSVQNMTPTLPFFSL